MGAAAGLRPGETIKPLNIDTFSVSMLRGAARIEQMELLDCQTLLCSIVHIRVFFGGYRYMYVSRLLSEVFSKLINVHEYRFGRVPHSFSDPPSNLFKGIISTFSTTPSFTGGSRHGSTGQPQKTRSIGAGHGCEKHMPRTRRRAII